MLQASEKAWRTIAHYSKAVAQEHDWQHKSHYDLGKARIV